MSSHLTIFNALMSTVSARDASGKIMQNAAKLAALRLKAGGSSDKELIARFENISKFVGATRRIIKLGKFLRHVESLGKQGKEKDSRLRLLLKLELLSRLVKDFVENVQTGTKFGFLPKQLVNADRLSRLFSTLKLIQSALSLWVAVLDIQRVNASLKESVEASSSNEKTRVQLTKVRAELFLLNLTAMKFVADFLSAGSELALRGFPGDQGACVAGVFSGVVDVYKMITKS